MFQERNIGRFISGCRIKWEPKISHYLQDNINFCTYKDKSKDAKEEILELLAVCPIHGQEQLNLLYFFIKFILAHNGCVACTRSVIVDGGHRIVEEMGNIGGIAYAEAN